MNQRYECLMGIHRGVYTAKPPVWVARLFLSAERVIFLKLTPMVHRKIAPTGSGDPKSDKNRELNGSDYKNKLDFLGLNMLSYILY